MTTHIRRFFSKDRNLALLLMVLGTYLVFFRPAEALRLTGPWDDTCYIVWLYRFVGVSTEACYSQAHTFGTAVLWIPAGLLGRILGWIFSTPPQAWIHALVGLSSFVFWAVSLFLVAAVLDNPAQQNQSCKKYLIPFIALLNVPLLYYVTRRTMMTHPVEFLLAIYCMWAASRRKFGWALVSYVLLVCTRINQLPLILVLFGAYLDHHFAAKFEKFHFPKYLGVLLALVGIALAIPIYRIAFHTGYDQVTVPGMWNEFSMARLQERFLAPPFALLFTATTFLAVFAWGLARFKDLNWMGRGTMVWMASQLFICVFWPTNGGSFGYRYLIGSYAGAIFVYAELKRLADQKPTSLQTLLLRFIHVSAVYVALWLTLLSWIFNSRLWPWRASSVIPEGWLGIFTPLQSLGKPLLLAGLGIYSSLGTVFISLIPDIEALQQLESLAQHRFTPSAAWALFAWTLAIIVAIAVFSSRLVGRCKMRHNQLHD